jgi:hypothetical protein
MPGAIRNIKQTWSKVADFIIKNYSQVNKNDWPKIDVNCNFGDFDSNIIYLSYCNRLIYKKYTVLFGIQLGMLVPLICPYTQEPDHWNHLQWKLVTQQFDCQQAENASARWHLQDIRNMDCPHLSVTSSSDTLVCKQNSLEWTYCMWSQAISLVARTVITCIPIPCDEWWWQHAYCTKLTWICMVHQSTFKWDWWIPIQTRNICICIY